MVRKLALEFRRKGIREDLSTDTYIGSVLKQFLLWTVIYVLLMLGHDQGPLEVVFELKIESFNCF